MLLALLLIVALAACKTHTQAPSAPEEPQQELTLLPGSASPDDLPSVTPPETAPDEAQAPPETAAPADTGNAAGESGAPAPAEDGSYTSKEDVALYIHLYGHLPDNFITKRDAEALGWSGGSLEPYAPGKCIGGSRFGNYEGLLPSADGRRWTECDIDTLGASGRGAKRIVFSNDGLIYYTGDHYKSFELLYGEEQP